jgi:hypothetical protein
MFGCQKKKTPLCVPVLKEEQKGRHKSASDEDHRSSQSYPPTQSKRTDLCWVRCCGWEQCESCMTECLEKGTALSPLSIHHLPRHQPLLWKRWHTHVGRRGLYQTWRTARSPGFKQQNVFSKPRFGDNNTDFHVVCTTQSDMSLASVRRSPHCTCDESKKECFSRDLDSFLVCAHQFIWLNVFLFSYVCMCHAPTRTWETNELRPSLHTQVHEVCEHSWSKMVSRMTLRRFHMSWRYECPCAHTKPRQITLQRGFLGITDEQVDLCSRTPIHMTVMFIRTVLGVLETTVFVL